MYYFLVFSANKSDNIIKKEKIKLKFKTEFLFTGELKNQLKLND